jgi:hypothetical protein
MGALDNMVKINWEVINTYSKDVQDKVKICESCPALGKNTECTEHECGCFATSIVVENKGCPLNKW